MHGGRREEALARSLLLDSAAEPAFDRVTGLVVDLLRVPVALISLVDETRQFFKSSAGLPEPWCSARQTPLSHSFCKVVVATDGPLTVSDARRDPAFAESPAIQDLGVVAYAGWPIRFEGQTLGSLCAIDSTPRDWAPEDLTLLSRLAGLVEEMIELRLSSLGRERVQDERLAAARRARAAADDRHRAEQTAMQAVVDINRRLQRALLPRPAEVGFANFVVSSIYEPGTRKMLLGGDFADVREGDDGGLDFVIGDVTGHGPEAAALGAALRTSWHALRSIGTPLEDVTPALNAALAREQSGDDLLATAIVGSIDAEGATLRLSVAGHPPPLLVAEEPRFLDVRVGRGTLLGYRDDTRWPVADVPLDGRSVLVYTDGATEGRTGHGRRDGEDLMLETVSEWCRDGGPGLLPNAVVRAAERANGAPIGDDIAILHIRARR